MASCLGGVVMVGAKERASMLILLRVVLSWANSLSLRFR